MKTVLLLFLMLLFCNPIVAQNKIKFLENYKPKWSVNYYFGSGLDYLPPFDHVLFGEPKTDYFKNYNYKIHQVNGMLELDFHGFILGVGRMNWFLPSYRSVTIKLDIDYYLEYYYRYELIKVGKNFSLNKKNQIGFSYYYIARALHRVETSKAYYKVAKEIENGAKDYYWDFRGRFSFGNKTNHIYCLDYKRNWNNYFSTYASLSHRNLFISKYIGLYNNHNEFSLNVSAGINLKESYTWLKAKRKHE